MSARRGVEISGPCPYCQFVFAVVVRDIRGERHVLECQDCKQPFAVEATVPRVELRTHAFAGVDVDKVLDDLSRPKAAPAEPHTPPAATPKSGEAQKVATSPRGTTDRTAPAAAQSPAPSSSRAGLRSLHPNTRAAHQRLMSSDLKRRRVNGTYGER